MADDFKTTVEELFKGMDSFITSKTVVGEAVEVGDTVILPLMDVSFAVGAGAGAGSGKGPEAGGGMGGKMTPSAVLVISNGTTKMVSVKNQDGINKLLDMVPDLINKLTAGKKDNSPEKTDDSPETEKA